MGRREEEHALPVGPQAAALHELPLAREGRDGEAVGDGLAECREIGGEVVEGLRARKVPPESRDHLVEDEDGALRAAEVPEAMEEFVARRLDCLGFQDDARDAARVRREHRLGAREIVVAEADRQVADRLGDSGGHRGRADEPVVRREERLVLAHGHEIAVRVRPGELDRGRRDVRAVLRELDHLGGGEHFEERLGALELERRRPREVDAEAHLPGRGLDHRLESVAERDRPKAHAVLEELVPVAVPDAAALAPHEERRRVGGKLIIAFRVRVRSAGDHLVHPLAEARRRGRVGAGERRARSFRQGDSYRVAGAGVFQTSQGVSPREYMSSRSCFSLNVSMPM